MSLYQSVNESTFFINENNQHVLNILKTVLAIPNEHAYTMKSDNLETKFFMIYDGEKYCLHIVFSRIQCD